jgi:hypothetical protein
MPVVAGIAFAITIVISLASFEITPDPSALFASPWYAAFGIISSILQALLLAPLAIVVHRYVLLGELTNRYPLDASSSRYVRFVGFAILINLLWFIPALTIQASMGSQEHAEAHPAMTIIGVLVGLILFVIVTIVVVRRAILFPAIAIDAPGATWSNARNDTKGSSWRVAFIFFCTALPFMIVAGLLNYFLLKYGHPLISAILGSIVAIPALCAFAAAASHVFRARADRLTQ